MTEGMEWYHGSDGIYVSNLTNLTVYKRKHSFSVAVGEIIMRHVLTVPEESRIGLNYADCGWFWSIDIVRFWA